VRDPNHGGGLINFIKYKRLTSEVLGKCRAHVKCCSYCALYQLACFIRLEMSSSMFFQVANIHKMFMGFMKIQGGKYFYLVDLLYALILLMFLATIMVNALGCTPGDLPVLSEITCLAGICRS
jgi:hypothetical protein